jgi:hypothetical protein
LQLLRQQKERTEKEYQATLKQINALDAEIKKYSLCSAFGRDESDAYDAA